MAKSIIEKQQDALLLIVKKASSDESCDIEKLKYLMESMERMQDKSAKVAFFEALSACQKEMPVVVRDATNDNTHSDYAKLETIQKTIKECYTRHGFSLSFSNTDSKNNDCIRFVGDLMHEQGYEKQYFMDLPIDNFSDGENNNQMHGIGSANSYGRRYLTQNIFNVVIAGQDNDGNSLIETWNKQVLECESLEQLSVIEKEADRRGVLEKLKDSMAKRKADLSNGITIDGELVLPSYPDKKFESVFPGCKEKILKGDSTKEQLISILSTKYKLTKDQLERINEVEK